MNSYNPLHPARAIRIRYQLYHNTHIEQSSNVMNGTILNDACLTLMVLTIKYDVESECAKEMSSGHASASERVGKHGNCQ